MPRFPTLRTFSLCALIGVWALLPQQVFADDIDELKARLERLEQQNEQLRTRLDRQETQPARPTEPDEIFVDGADAGSQTSEGIDTFTADAKPKESSSKAKEEDEWYEVGSDLKMNASWKNGMEFESKNKDFRFHVGGRTQMDLSFFEAPNNVQFGPGGTGAIRDGFDFRRARLRADGTMYDQIEWVVEYDFMNSSGNPPTTQPAPTDGYFTFTKLPYVGNFRIGLQKEPIGMEHLTSSRFLSFMERSFNQDAFYGGFNNGFNPGLTIFDNFAEERGAWWLGAYKVTSNAYQFNVGGGEFAATGRVTYLPWYVDEGRGLMHLGLSLRKAGLDEGAIRYRVRGPERAGLSAIWPLYGDTGSINGKGQNQLNAEFAAVFGTVNIQADYMFNQVEDGSVGKLSPLNLFYHGGYVEALWFLTGEHRVYNKKSAVFERVTPTENFFLANGPFGVIRGKGAWQAGVRYKYLDLNDKSINGGILNDVTFGLNRFLNPNLKLQSNYSLTERQSATNASNGLIQGLGFRLAHDF